MSSATVRAAVKADATHIHRFIVELAIYEKAEHEVKSTVADIEATVFSEGCTAHALIVELDGKPAGMAVYFFNYSTWLGQNGIYLEDLYVSPKHRGLGLGKKLMAQLACIAKEKNCARMDWSVLDWNQPAIDVYDALDAKPQSEWIGYRLTGDALDKLAATVKSYT
jgi:GNAT superfamily N-acetyltransferase